MRLVYTVYYSRTIKRLQVLLPLFEKSGAKSRNSPTIKRQEQAPALRANSKSFVGDDGLLRFGHASALICHRHIIHSLGAASLPRRPKGLEFALSSSVLCVDKRVAGFPKGASLWRGGVFQEEASSLLLNASLVTFCAHRKSQTDTPFRKAHPGPPPVKTKTYHIQTYEKTYPLSLYLPLYNNVNTKIRTRRLMAIPKRRRYHLFHNPYLCQKQ